MKSSQPTNGTNAVYRLFLRYFIVYLATVPAGLFLARHGWWAALSPFLGVALASPLLLAAIGAFSTLTTPFLFLLTAAKAVVDATLLHRLLSLVSGGALGFWHFNAVLFLLMGTLILCLFSVARAHLFSFTCIRRNGGLLRSGLFWRYVLDLCVLSVIYLLFKFCWQRLLPTLG